MPLLFISTIITFFPIYVKQKTQHAPVLADGSLGTAYPNPYISAGFVTLLILLVFFYSEPVLRVFVNIFVAASSSIYFILTDWMKGQNDKQELANQTLQSELKFLKSQINPHFLFNTLNSLYALTLKKSDLAPEIVLKLSEMMRYMLYECNEKYVPLDKEVNYVINYLDLEKLRHGKNQH